LAENQVSSPQPDPMTSPLSGSLRSLGQEPAAPRSVERAASPPPDRLAAFNNVAYSNVTPMSQQQQYQQPSPQAQRSASPPQAPELVPQQQQYQQPSQQAQRLAPPPIQTPQQVAQALPAASGSPRFTTLPEQSEFLSPRSQPRVLEPRARMVRERTPIVVKGGPADVGIVLKDNPDGSLVVGEIVPGGPASEGGQVRLGDALIDVDGYDVVGRPVSTTILFVGS
jgi:C-terminal processing protease CtpA/Prc